MGVPARKIDTGRTPKGLHLRLVGSSRARSGSRKKTAGAAAHNCRIFVAFIALLAVMGLGRVWLSVQATAASLEATDLRQSIKQERYQGDMLEVRQSALGAPSRIKAIAGKAMNMAPAESVSYLELSDSEDVASSQNVDHAASAGFGGVLAKLLDLTAGEAQVLLVGDVGLAATR